VSPSTQGASLAGKVAWITGGGSGIGLAGGIELARAGAAGLHLEDQVQAKRCGHRPGKALVTADEMVDRLKAAGLPVVAIGKIEDLFAGQGMTAAVHTKSDAEGMDEVLRAIREVGAGLIFANLVDFDTLYGHRNDVEGYAANLERFDERLASLLPALRPDDLLVLTADHGNDPTTPSTDHSREYVPLLVAGAGVRPGADLGTRPTYADLAATLAEMFCVPGFDSATSFLAQLRQS